VGKDCYVYISCNPCGRQLVESKGRELSEWARVHVLKFSIDESKLEQHVIAAKEAEAMTQQRLATAEAEIAKLGQKLETSKRYLIHVSIHCSVSLLEMQSKKKIFFYFLILGGLKLLK
jgi:hypothetical protein